MLIGHVFQKQVFKNEAFALFIDTFLDKNMGVVKGCGLSKTNNTVTIADGYFVIKGRFLEILNGETITINTNGYYSLVCEIDLSQENTQEQFNQASIKVIRGASTYPTLTKQDLNNGGTLYQYEFARFRKTDNGIIDFTDKRTYLNLESVYSQITDEYESILTDLQQELEEARSQEGVLLKSDFATLTATLTTPLVEHVGVAYMSYPTGFNQTNTIVISAIPIDIGNPLDANCKYYRFIEANNIERVALENDRIAVEYYDEEEDVSGTKIEITLKKKIN